MLTVSVGRTVVLPSSQIRTQTRVTIHTHTHTSFLTLSREGACLTFSKASLRESFFEKPIEYCMTSIINNKGGECLKIHKRRPLVGKYMKAFGLTNIYLKIKLILYFYYVFKA